MKADPVDLAAYQVGATSLEKSLQSHGDGVHAKKNRHHHKDKHPMASGVHRAVC